MHDSARAQWEPGGDLITLTVRVAGVTVVSGVIGHCRPSQSNKLDWLSINLKVKRWGSLNSTPLQYSMDVLS
jgi:hypothetical protein